MSRPLTDPVAETQRILLHAESKGIPLRAVGRIAIALRAPSIRRLRPDRIHDRIELAGRAPLDAIETVLGELGYGAARRADAGIESMQVEFLDGTGRPVGVSLGVLRSYHELPFGERLTLDPVTLSLADLLLATLQSAEMTDDDVQDVAALLADHELTDDDTGIGMRRIAAICANDWGWWKSVDDNLRALIARWREDSTEAVGVERQILAAAANRAGGLQDRLTATPKSTTWRLRAVAGERVRWYEAREGT